VLADAMRWRLRRAGSRDALATVVRLLQRDACCHDAL